MLHKKPAYDGEPVENTQDWDADAQREDAVACELAASGLVDATEVKVAVKNDEARLTGEVATEGEVTTAGTIALSVGGISRVRNGLRIKDGVLDAQAQTRTL